MYITFDVSPAEYRHLNHYNFEKIESNTYKLAPSYYYDDFEKWLCNAGWTITSKHCPQLEINLENMSQPQITEQLSQHEISFYLARYHDKNVWFYNDASTSAS